MHPAENGIVPCGIIPNRGSSPERKPGAGIALVASSQLRGHRVSQECSIGGLDRRNQKFELGAIQACG